jgi:hypothetical protein
MVTVTPSIIHFVVRTLDLAGLRTTQGLFGLVSWYMRKGELAVVSTATLIP